MFSRSFAITGFFILFSEERLSISIFYIHHELAEGFIAASD
jgi:hypothetical protein